MKTLIIDDHPTNRKLRKACAPKLSPAHASGGLELMKQSHKALAGKLQAKSKELRRRRKEVTTAKRDLERRVRERTTELEEANKDLEAFNDSVAHDLRNPVNVIRAFAHQLELACEHKLTHREKKYARKIAEYANRMDALIVDLLELSQGTRAPMNRAQVDLSALARQVVRKLREAYPKRTVAVVIEPDVFVEGDAQLLRIALENLLNAWKFTGRREHARVQFGVEPSKGEPVYSVRDNGAGFDMDDKEKVFHAFQRLHSRADFPGTGIGLTTVQRIIRRHGGRIWAEGTPDQGATFYFTLSNGVSRTRDGSKSN